MTFVFRSGPWEGSAQSQSLHHGHDAPTSQAFLLAHTHLCSWGNKSQGNCLCQGWTWRGVSCKLFLIIKKCKNQLGAEENC